MNFFFQILESLCNDDTLTAALLFRRTKYLCDQFTDKEKQSFNTLAYHTIFLNKISNLIYQNYLELTKVNNYKLNDQQLLRILFAICLLKEESFDQVILEFLTNRKIQCIELFNNSNQDESNKLLVFFKIIFNTLEIFFNMHDSVDEITVPFIVDQLNSVSIDYAFLNRNEKRLLDRLFVGFDLDHFVRIDNNLLEQFEKGIFDWLEQIKVDTSQCIQAYLQTLCIDNLYESLDKVHLYFNENEKLILKSHYYEVICKRKIDFWDHLLSSPFDSAWKYFLINVINRLFANLKNKIQYLNEEEETVLNITDYIWSTDLNDLNEMHKKYFGCTERIIELINQTNEEFNYLLDKFLFKKIKELNQTKFKSYFFETFKEKNDEFLVYVQNQIQQNAKREQKFNLAHFIRMLVLICPNYRQCLDNLVLRNWIETKEFLLNLSYNGYNSYINQIIEDLVQLFVHEYNGLNQALNCLHISNSWLEIEIKESIDDGKEVSTKIYVPKQISLPLENLLTNLTIKLTKLTGHTIPTKLKSMILNELADNLCAGYQNIYESMQGKTSRNQLDSVRTLQIYFDLMFLKNLLINSINDDKLKSDLLSTLNKFQQDIDPFDLHLFSSYILNNLEQNKMSLAMVLNYILPQHLQITALRINDSNENDDRKFDLKFNLL